jgi:hypothetical protein
VPAPSQRCGDPTSQLPQESAHASTIRSAVRPPRFAFDLRRPVKPRWPSSDIDLGGNPAGRRVSRAGPWMAQRGGPQNQCRMTGTPSLGEVPSGGAKALWLLSRSSKVTRRKGGTNSRRNRSNGYVHKPRKEWCRDSRRDGGISGQEHLPDTPLSRASPLPHKPTKARYHICPGISPVRAESGSATARPENWHQR